MGGTGWNTSSANTQWSLAYLWCHSPNKYFEYKNWWDFHPNLKSSHWSLLCKQYLLCNYAYVMNAVMCTHDDETLLSNDSRHCWFHMCMCCDAALHCICIVPLYWLELSLLWVSASWPFAIDYYARLQDWKLIFNYQWLCLRRYKRQQFIHSLTLQCWSLYLWTKWRS